MPFKDPEVRRQYIREYFKTYKNRWFVRNRKKYNAYMRAYAKKHRLEYSARGKVSYALRTGKIKRLPCEQCGNMKSESHHDDYAKPLNIRWLCKQHHEDHHRLMEVL